jgi:replicative DNA helicase
LLQLKNLIKANITQEMNSILSYSLSDIQAYIHQTNGIEGIKSGFELIDENTEGHIAGEVYLILAQSYEGADVLMNNLALNYAGSVSTEAIYFNNFAFNARMLAQLSEAKPHQSNANFTLTNMCGINKWGVIKKHILAQKAKGISAFFIHHFQSIKNGAPYNYRNYELSGIMKDLKAIALKHGLYIVISSDARLDYSSSSPLYVEFFPTESKSIQFIADKVITLKKSSDNKLSKSSRVFSLGISKGKTFMPFYCNVWHAKNNPQLFESSTNEKDEIGFFETENDEFSQF